MLKRTHFSELSILGLLHKRNPRLHTSFPNARSEKRKVQAQNDHKSNAASKHINCSSISIHYKLNLPRETDAKLQFASKISSLNVSDRPRTHSPRRGPLKTSVVTLLVTLPPLQTVPRRRPPRHLASINFC